MTRPHAIEVDRDLDCVTRDGTTLRADVFRPADEGPYPALVCRTPYDKTTDRLVENAEILASAGYCVVVQDIRGRLASEGEYRWMFRDSGETFDATDGFDTVEWAATLPWSNGDVGTWGHSNEGWAAWMTVSSSPPSLRTAFISGISETHRQMTFGVFETGRRLQWSYKMGRSDPRAGAEPTGSPVRPIQECDRLWAEVERGKYVWRLPLSEIPADVFNHVNDQLHTYYQGVAGNPWDFSDLAAKATIPIMQLTGWWDRLIGTVFTAEKLFASSPPELQGEHRLILGPWGHNVTELHGRIGPVDYGPDADRSYSGILRRWFDLQLKGIDDGIGSEDPVQLFIIGENAWRGETTWPIERATERAFYLHSGAAANTVHGDGALSLVPPDGAPASDTRYDRLPPEDLSGAELDRYVFDPRDPLTSLMGADSQMIPVDQAPHDDRKDVLVYDTPPLDSELELVGMPRLALWAASDGADTDWTAKLALVYQDGLAVNLTYGILRAQYRNGFDEPQLLTPNKAYEFNVPLNPIGVRIQPGQRLRLYVSSSDFPNFDRNHNTGAPFWSDPKLRTAHQTVFHTSAMPSRLLLPVIE